MDNSAKVSYVKTTGQISTAYIDTETGVGEDKYSDEPVKVFWNEGLQNWYEIKGEK